MENEACAMSLEMSHTGVRWLTCMLRILRLWTVWDDSFTILFSNAVMVCGQTNTGAKSDPKILQGGELLSVNEVLSQDALNCVGLSITMVKRSSLAIKDWKQISDVDVDATRTFSKPRSWSIVPSRNPLVVVPLKRMGESWLCCFLRTVF